jgi:hypothetical protein
MTTLVYTRPSQVTEANKRLEREANAERAAWVWFGRLQWFAAGACAGCIALWASLILGV